MILDVPANAQDEFLFRHLDRAAADFAVTLFDRHADVGDREIVSAQFRGIDSDLVLFHEPAD